MKEFTCLARVGTGGLVTGRDKGQWLLIFMPYYPPQITDYGKPEQGVSDATKFP